MVMIHEKPHPLAGQTVKLQLVHEGHNALKDGHLFTVEDWWDRVSGESWQAARGNWTTLHYALRSVLADLPLDDEVVYGKDEAGYGHLVHVSEMIELEEKDAA